MPLTLFLENSPLAFILVCVLLGLIVGSFLNVVIHRLPIMMDRSWRAEAAEVLGQPAPEDGKAFNLVVPRSRCPHCGHAITALENVPILSYLVLRGRCSACRARISPRYVLVEMLSGLLSGWVAWHFGFGWQTFAGLLFTWALIPLAVIDLETQLLPDSITLPVIWLGLLFNLRHVFTDLPSAVVGAMAGYLTLWTVYHGFRLLTGKEGMGPGDFKLYALLGAWLGWQQLLVVLLIASGVGSIVGLLMVALRRVARLDTPIPFGPYLAAAGWIALLWGTTLTTAYLGLGGAH